MLHKLLSKDERTIALEIAYQAAATVQGAATTGNGTQSILNADGTRTVIGAGAGTDGAGGAVGVAQWVGDTTAPGRPTGLSATSEAGVTVVSWDGTLDGGVPADFDHVNVLMHYRGTDHKVGELVSAGSVTLAGLDEGMQYGFRLAAEDAARAQDGSPAHNVSDPSEMVVVMASQVPISGVDVEYALGDSPDTAPATGWATDSPTWESGRYVWQRTATTTASGTSYSDPVCIQGAKGEDGDGGVTVALESSRGVMFKNTVISTSIIATVYADGGAISDIGALRQELGEEAGLSWSVKGFGEESYMSISDGDPRITSGGFILVLSPGDVSTQAIFRCEVSA